MVTWINHYCKFSNANDHNEKPTFAKFSHLIFPATRVCNTDSILQITVYFDTSHTYIRVLVSFSIPYELMEVFKIHITLFWENGSLPTLTLLNVTMTIIIIFIIWLLYLLFCNYKGLGSGIWGSFVSAPLIPCMFKWKLTKYIFANYFINTFMH